MTEKSILEADFMTAYFNLIAHHPDAEKIIEEAKVIYSSVQDCEID